MLPIQKLLDLLPSLIGERDGFMLLVHRVVAGQIFSSTIYGISHRVQIGNAAIDAVVLIGALMFRWSRK